MVKNMPKGAHRASAVERLDVAAVKAARPYRKALPVRAVALAAKLADQPPLLAASALTLGLGLMLRSRRLTRTAARMLATELAGIAIKGSVKHFVVRTRPTKMFEDGRYALHADSDGDKDAGPWNSFPSGHTAGAVGIARAIAREYPATALPGGAAAAAVALVQVPEGQHFPSDVLAGAAIGLAAEALVDRAARAISD